VSPNLVKSSIGPLDEDCAVIVGEHLASFIVEMVGRPIKAGAVEVSASKIAVAYVNPDEPGAGVANLQAERVMEDPLEGDMWIVHLGWLDKLGDHDLRFVVFGEPDFLPKVTTTREIFVVPGTRPDPDHPTDEVLRVAVSALVGREVRLSHYVRETPPPTVLAGMVHQNLALLPIGETRWIGWAGFHDEVGERTYLRFRVQARQAPRSSEAKRSDLKPPKARVPEILARDLPIYLDACAGRCDPINVWEYPHYLMVAYRVEGQPMLAKLRLVPMSLLEGGEEHWKGTFHFGPKGGRQHRTFHLVGKTGWQFESIRGRAAK